MERRPRSYGVVGIRPVGRDPASGRSFSASRIPAERPVTAVLAIDQGTTATKAVVVTLDGTVLAEAEQPVPVRAGADGAVEADPEQLWQSVVTSGQLALDRAGVPVQAVGLANQGESVLAWSPQDGTPLSTCVLWQDRRAAETCARLRPYQERLAQISGLPLDPYFSAPKLRWVRDHLTTAGVVTTTDSWLLHRLTGEFVTDVATASRSMLLDIDAMSWSDEAWRIFGLDEPRPRLVSNDEVVGTTRIFGADLPVGGVIVDQQAALWAQGARERGQTKCTYGTGAFLLANTGATPVRGGHGLAPSVAWRVGGRPSYCLDGQLYAVGAALGWLIGLGLLDDVQDLDRVLERTPHSDGLIFVPALAGLGAPFWRPDARAAFLGMSLSTTRDDLVRAVCESIAAHVAELVEAAAPLGDAAAALRVDGGLTRSGGFLQLQADVAGIPILPCLLPHATALGVADLAARACLGDGVAEPAVGTVVDPDPAAGWTGDFRFAWRAAVTATSQGRP
jgi:glycerol kinase